MESFQFFIRTTLVWLCFNKAEMKNCWVVLIKCPAGTERSQSYLKYSATVHHYQELNHNIKVHTPESMGYANFLQIIAARDKTDSSLEFRWV